MSKKYRIVEVYDQRLDLKYFKIESSTFFDRLFGLWTYEDLVSYVDDPSNNSHALSKNSALDKVFSMMQDLKSGKSRMQEHVILTD